MGQLFLGRQARTEKTRGTVGHLGQQTKPFGFKQLSVPGLSQTVPDWDKMRQKVGMG